MLFRSKTNVCRDVSYRHPYAAAIEQALERGCMQQGNGRFRPDAPISSQEFSSFCEAFFGQSAPQPHSPITHAQAIELLAAMAARDNT